MLPALDVQVPLTLLKVGSILNAVWTIQNDRLVKTLPRSQSLALTAPLLLTNIVATSLVGIQVW